MELSPSYAWGLQNRDETLNRDMSVYVFLLLTSGMRIAKEDETRRDEVVVVIIYTDYTDNVWTDYTNTHAKERKCE